MNDDERSAEIVSDMEYAYSIPSTTQVKWLVEKIKQLQAECKRQREQLLMAEQRYRALLEMSTRIANAQPTVLVITPPTVHEESEVCCSKGGAV